MKSPREVEALEQQVFRLMDPFLSLPMTMGMVEVETVKLVFMKTKRGIGLRLDLLFFETTQTSTY